MSHKAHPAVYIVILNWNGWKDTIACLESVFKTAYTDYRVILCDNHSTDGSFWHLRSYLASRFPNATWDSLLSSRPGHKIAKRVESAEICRPLSSPGDAAGCQHGVVLVRTTSNLGYAGGNNIGIVFALSHGDADYVWLLNNDTIVEPQSLPEMVKRIQIVDNAGICGSTILFAHDPKRIQALAGARYLKWVGIGVHIGSNTHWSRNVPAEAVEKQLSYVMGASLLVSTKFLSAVGLMHEGYFLYYEEIDWAKRAAGRFKLTYAPNSIVYHKEGGSIGSNQYGATRSPKSFYWLTRSRLRFTLKYYPEAIPSLLLYSLINCTQWAIFNRNPRIFLAGIKACAHACLNIDQSRLKR
jgi:GT2 family glycosyltransferase